ncbi:META domain-containing protein [Oleomonas cavernae]|uniref:META domain-containing protein n=1 Tax=Oleomonas cavernae TaxID=2320859 RepID=UPI0013144AB4|nr:META domain-containing protein [Oleomonas cavernae]
MGQASALALGLAMAGCGTIYVAARPAGAGLAGVDWVADEMTLGPIVKGRAPTMTIAADGRVSGQAGCNSYGGTARVEGETIDFDQVFATRMFCEDAMAQETAFLQSLEQATRYAFDGDRLLLLDARGGRLVVFHRKTP